jgi:hypothetical protein
VFKTEQNQLLISKGRVFKTEPNQRSASDIKETRNGTRGGGSGVVVVVIVVKYMVAVVVRLTYRPFRGRWRP